MPAILTPSSAARLRLAGQRLLASTFTRPVEAVKWMTAMQGQDLPGALWSVGLRVPGAGRSAVQAALDAGEIVRSWPLRGTLHLTAAEDLGWILSLTSGRMVAGQTGRHRQLGIEDRDVEVAREAAHRVLEEHGEASRDELMAAFQTAGQETTGQRGIHLLWLLSLTGTLVQGPSHGNGQKFMLMERWIPAPRVLDRSEALAELATRYFTSHGPATLQDFAWWAKLTLTDARAGLAAAQPDLAEAQLDGSSVWMAPETAALSDAKAVPGAQSLLLLPGFDEFLLGYADRSAALAPEHAEAIVPGGNGVFRSTIVAGGRVAGTWAKGAKTPKGGAAVVVPSPFAELTAAQQRKLDKAAAAYATFMAS
ncbi:winged helix DNA-binding domain-containing protein [Arthrobacter sp. 35W]|uniref:winged helix DNA-binding domain-containing protein n=1 Tax=Arthrobacter sp. 35W TaxID=1132441 RepID=UPI00040D3CAD|nr:winged helix DNA-binding domain-containing protein [Arthrobacter sp. 35W]